MVDKASIIKYNKNFKEPKSINEEENDKGNKKKNNEEEKKNK